MGHVRVYRTRPASAFASASIKLTAFADAVGSSHHDRLVGGAAPSGPRVAYNSLMRFVCPTFPVSLSPVRKVNFPVRISELYINNDGRQSGL